MWRRGRNRREPKQSSRGAKKSRAFTGDSPHPPHRPNEPDATLPARPNDVANDDDVFADTSRTPQDKVESKERLMWQLLLQRSSGQQTHIVLVAVGPSFSPAYSTAAPRPFPGHNPPHKGVVTMYHRRRRQVRSLRHMTWWT